MKIVPYFSVTNSLLTGIFYLRLYFYAIPFEANIGRTDYFNYQFIDYSETLNICQALLFKFGTK